MKLSFPALSRYVVPDMPTTDQILPYLRQIDENRWYSNFGPLVSQFEDRLTMHLTSGDESGHAPLAVTTLMSCYHALQIGLQLFRLPKDAKVLIPAVTFPACPLAVRHARAEPVLTDVDPHTWQLTPKTARRAAEKMPVHAVMPVALYGVPVPVDAWDKFTEDTGIPVIIDAAAALEAQPIPKHGLVAYSLHATKPFCIGEGGVLIGRNRAWIDEARCISNFGTQMRVALQDGSNAKMSEYHGAIALAQLDRWEDMKQRRHAIFIKCRDAILGMGIDVRFQKGIEDTIAGTIMLSTLQPRATAIVNELNARSIAAHRMYLPPLYHHPHFANLLLVNREGKSLAGTTAIDIKTTFMEGSEFMQDHVFGVPFHVFVRDNDMDHMARALAETLAHHSSPSGNARHSQSI